MIEKDHIFDKRIIDRNIERGRLTEEEYETHLKALPDEADKAEEIVVEVEEGEFKIEFPEPVDEDEDYED
jgi:hypothetical protein